MILFFIPVAIFIVVFEVSDVQPKWRVNYLMISMLFIIACMVLIIIGNNATSKISYNHKVTEYEYLVSGEKYPYNKNLVSSVDDDIEIWNTELARYQNLDHNAWTGWFVANYWDELEYIQN